MLYLYIKTHIKTGLKYFGKTTSDPNTYKGSGTLWLRHIKKHGNDVITEIYGQYEESDTEKCKRDALEFSLDNNIVESKEWANLKLETLDGGFDHINSLPRELRRQNFFSWWDKLSPEEKEIINSKKGRPGHLNSMYGVHRCGKDNPFYGKTHDQKTREIISESKKGKLVVKDVNTNEIVGSVPIDHPMIVKGEWVSVNCGKTRTEEYKKARSEQNKKRGIRPPSPKGMLWWNDGIVEIRAKENPGKEYSRGRLKKKK